MFKGTNILITGGTGSIGSEIARCIKDANLVKILSNDEDGIYHLSKELSNPMYQFMIGDVRDKERMKTACEDIDIVFHAAALKHVPLCERNPVDAVQTNVLGTQNVIEACISQRVQKMIAISTDKAVEPINTMGTTKLLAEKLVIDATYSGSKTIFSIVRFGNVMGSRGSVIPLWVEQAQRGPRITLTDPNMTRFMMSVREAIQLIFKATELANGGDIFTFDMPVVKMKDLAYVIRDEVCKNQKKKKVPIVITGMRPGEKLYEALMTEDEASKARLIHNLYVIPLVARTINVNPDLFRSYQKIPMSRRTIGCMLRAHRMIEKHYLHPYEISLT